MEKVVFVAWLCCCLLITAGTDSQIAQYVEIENCNGAYMDIRENANNTIVCKGFNQSHTIAWSIEMNGQPRTPVATCGPSSHCTVHQPDHFAVERSPSHSTLFYQQYDRELDKVEEVFCESQFASTTRTATCRLNVINPANLSSCSVEEDRDRGTVKGSCRFDHAYSYSRGFFCIWYQETDGQSKRFSGSIEYDSSSFGPSGWCTFTSTNMTWAPGTYIYSIDFYPGPGKVKVDIANIATSSPDVSLQTTKDSVHNTSPKTQEENDLPLGAIVGGIVAVVAVVIVLVVVVVVFVRRKRNQKPAGSAHGSSNDNATDNDDFEEHVTPMYSTSGRPEASREIDENTYEIPAHRPSNAEPEHVYNISNTAATTTTTTTTTLSNSIATTTGRSHNTTTHQHRGQGKTLDTVHHSPVYVNENQPGEESSGVQQHPTYANDHPETAQGDTEANRDSNPYYSEIKDTSNN